MAGNVSAAAETPDGKALCLLKEKFVDGGSGNGLTNTGGEGIIKSGGGKMNILPNADKVVIPARKFIEYTLNLEKDFDKATAFELALGYNQGNAGKLIENIRANLGKFPATPKGNKDYGDLYEVVMILTGENGKTAKVLTAWIDDSQSGEMRLITVHID